MSDDIVYANSTLTTEHGGRVVTLKTGEAWAANDPFVIERKDLFTDVSPIPPRRTTPRVETTARRGPGSSSARITR